MFFKHIPLVKLRLLLFTESIKRVIDKTSIKFAQSVKVESKNGKLEDRVLVGYNFNHMVYPMAILV